MGQARASSAAGEGRQLLAEGEILKNQIGTSLETGADTAKQHEDQAQHDGTSLDSSSGKVNGFSNDRLVARHRRSPSTMTWSRTSRRTLPTQRSATPFCHGLRYAVLA